MEGFTIWLASVIIMAWFAVKPASLPLPPPPAPPVQKQPEPQPQPKPKLKESFILLPDAEGKETGIVIKANDHEITVTEPYKGVELSGGNMVNKTLSAEEVRQQFPEVIQALPEKPKTFRLVGAGFQVDSSELSPSASEKLDTVVEYALAHPDFLVDVSGHTDDSGPSSKEEYNLKLSLSRAEAVKTYLVKKGVSAKNIATHGFGFKRPIADNSSEKGRAENRRVEIFFVSH